jgi:D-tyrosyl-tRNA(Tyr) deacylase
MRAVIQRVSEARAVVGDETVGEIGPGLCILLGVGNSDNEDRASQLARKIANLRIFEDAEGKMNRSATDAGGAFLVVSQFTLYGDCRKGNRPSFTDAAPPAEAERLYVHFTDQLRQSGAPVTTGRFQAHMKLALVNDGPVTIVLEI